MANYLKIKLVFEDGNQVEITGNSQDISFEYVVGADFGLLKLINCIPESGPVLDKATNHGRLLSAELYFNNKRIRSFSENAIRDFMYNYGINTQTGQLTEYLDIILSV